MKDREYQYLLMFNRVDNYNARLKYEIYNRYGSFEKIFSKRKEIERLTGKHFKIGAKDFDSYSKEGIKGIIESEMDYYRSNSVGVIGIDSSDYPERLKNIYDPPLVLFVKGNLQLLRSEYSVAFVGSRRATNRGLVKAFTLSERVSNSGVTVISGLAKGIDSYSHKGALKGRGSTVAVMAGGIDNIYPKQNRELWKEITLKGAVVTEFSMGTLPLKYHFPRRNRLISGLACGTIVVEAALNSGALITARYSLDQGREVMSVPGNPDSEFYSGNNYLIKQGAHLVENYLDIMNIIGKKPDINENSFIKINSRGKLGFSNLERDILNTLGDDTLSIIDIERATGYPIQRIISSLILLELKGLVVQKPGKFFSRVV